MPAHYAWNSQTPLGAQLRGGLNSLRSAQHELLDILRILQQMNAAQVSQAFSFSDGVQSPSEAFSAAAVAELESDLPNLDIGTVGGAAIQQMLDMFG